jgi:hypothetical protein
MVMVGRVLASVCGVRGVPSGEAGCWRRRGGRRGWLKLEEKAAGRGWLTRERQTGESGLEAEDEEIDGSWLRPEEKTAVKRAQALEAGDDADVTEGWDVSVMMREGQCKEGGCLTL